LQGDFFLQQDFAFIQLSLALALPKFSMGCVLSRITKEASMAAAIFIPDKDNNVGGPFLCRSS
jgi:hypothetical protein